MQVCLLVRHVGGERAFSGLSRFFTDIRTATEHLEGCGRPAIICVVPRLFFALSLPGAVSDSLDFLCEGIPHARWALENEFHITLSFLGEVPRHRLSDVLDIASSMRAPRFELTLEGAGVFPHRGQPRVLWVGVRKEERLFAFQRTLQNELRHGDFELDRRKFHPHVTLARVDHSPREPLSDWLGHHLNYQSDTFRVRRFHLVSSELLSHGARHTVEETFSLHI